jgi:hypothetical protein
MPVKHIWEDKPPAKPPKPGKPPARPNPTPINKRAIKRQDIVVPARLTWRDHLGMRRFATVATRNVSDFGVFVECPTRLVLPLYRLVHFEIEPAIRACAGVPETLRHGRVLAAVYRVTHDSRTCRHGIALRLMIDPMQYEAATAIAGARA